MKATSTKCRDSKIRRSSQVVTNVATLWVEGGREMKPPRGLIHYSHKWEAINELNSPRAIAIAIANTHSTIWLNGVVVCCHTRHPPKLFRFRLLSRSSWGHGNWVELLEYNIGLPTNPETTDDRWCWFGEPQLCFWSNMAGTRPPRANKNTVMSAERWSGV